MDVTFLEAVKIFYNRWNDFDGRSSRSEFWYAVLYLFVASSFIGIINEWVASVFGIINIIPWVAVSIRRMHDIGKSGWWVLINFVPIIGWIWYLALVLRPSGSAYTNGDNQSI